MFSFVLKRSLFARLPGNCTRLYSFAQNFSLPLQQPGCFAAPARFSLSTVFMAMFQGFSFTLVRELPKPSLSIPEQDPKKRGFVCEV